MITVSGVDHGAIRWLTEALAGSLNTGAPRIALELGDANVLRIGGERIDLGTVTKLTVDRIALAVGMTSLTATTTLLGASAITSTGPIDSLSEIRVARADEGAAATARYPGRSISLVAITAMAERDLARPAALPGVLVPPLGFVGDSVTIREYFRDFGRPDGCFVEAVVVDSDLLDGRWVGVVLVDRALAAWDAARELKQRGVLTSVPACFGNVPAMVVGADWA